jgi:hypothetical protein
MRCAFIFARTTTMVSQNGFTLKAALCVVVVIIAQGLLFRSDINIGRKRFETVLRGTPTSTINNTTIEAPRANANLLTIIESDDDGQKPQVKVLGTDQRSVDLDNFSGVTARAFEPWPVNRSLPCIEAEDNWSSGEVQHSSTRSGLIFLSLFKTGSTTSSGIHIRLSKHIARDHNQTMCKTRYMHMRAYALAPKRNRKKSFLWTIVRDPTKRVISQYFYNLYPPQTPSDEDFLAHIGFGPDFAYNHYLHRLSTIEPDTTEWKKEVDMAQAIIKEYDFIAITERMDESLVALAMLLHVPVTHMLHLKSNKANGEYSLSSRHEVCNFLLPSHVSPGMKEYLDSKDWQGKVH